MKSQESQKLLSMVICEGSFFLTFRNRSSSCLKHKWMRKTFTLFIKLFNEPLQLWIMILWTLHSYQQSFLQLYLFKASADGRVYWTNFFRCRKFWNIRNTCKLVFQLVRLSDGGRNGVHTPFWHRFRSVVLVRLALPWSYCGSLDVVLNVPLVFHFLSLLCRCRIQNIPLHSCVLCTVSCLLPSSWF